MPKLKCDCGKVYTLTDDMLRVRAGKLFTCSYCGKSRKLPPLASASQAVATPESEPELPPLVRKSTFVPFQPGQGAPPSAFGTPVQSVGFECPFCHSRNPPIVHSKVSTAGWVIFVLLLLSCFPLCIIGLMMKEQFRVCESCGIKLG